MYIVFFCFTLMESLVKCNTYPKSTPEYSLTFSFRQSASCLPRTSHSPCAVRVSGAIQQSGGKRGKMLDHESSSAIPKGIGITENGGARGFSHMWLP